MSLKRDDGFTLVEVRIAGLLAAVLIGLIGSFLISALRAGSFAQGHSATLNDVRNVMQQIEKEARGANSIDWCTSDGSCLEIDAQTPTGDFRLVRYTHDGSTLLRSVYDPDTATWTNPLIVVDRVVNTPAQPVFSNSACDANSITFQRVIVDLYIEPTPISDPTMHVETSFRPRNFPAVATCPTPSP